MSEILEQLRGNKTYMLVVVWIALQAMYSTSLLPLDPAAWEAIRAALLGGMFATSRAGTQKAEDAAREAIAATQHEQPSS